MTPFNNLSFPFNNTAFTLNDLFAPSEAELAKAAKAKAEFIDRISKDECTQDEFFTGFTNYHFTEDEIIAVCKALDTNTKITCFTFGACSAFQHKEHLPLICEKLKTNKTITSINLSRTDVGTDGLKEIVRLLKANQNITSLLLDYTNIHEEQAVALLSIIILTNKNLTILRIGGNKFSEINLNRLIDAILKNSTLKCLDLRNVKLFDKTMAERIAAVHPTLEVRRTEENPLDFQMPPEFLLSLQLPEVQISQVQTHQITQQSLTSGPFTALTRPPSLFSFQSAGSFPLLMPKPDFGFNLGFSQIYQPIKPVHKLETEHKIEADQTTESESTSKQDESESSSEQGNAVAKIMHARPIREHLDYSELLNNKKLIEAVLNRRCSENNFNAAFRALFFEGDQLRRLLQALDLNPDIQTIDLSMMNSKYHHQLEIFCEVLATNTTIKKLNLRFFNINEDDFTQIVKLSRENNTIVSLNLECNMLYSKKSVGLLCELILNNKVIRSLNIGSLRIEANDFLRIMDAISKNITLEEIGLGDCSKALKSKASNQHTLMIELLEMLKQHPSITSIDLSHNEFGIPEITAVANLLNANSRITHLNISNIGDDSGSGIKGLPDEGFQILGEALASTNTLRHLTINLLRAPSPLALKAIMSGLIRNSSLSRLDFDTYLEDKDMDNFFSYLKNQTNIVCIKLPMIFSVNDKFDKLDDLLKSNKRIRGLHFSCSLNAELYEKLIKLLQDNPQITGLGVSYDPHFGKRELYDRRIQLQLEKNQQKDRNALRQSFLSSLYKRESNKLLENDTTRKTGKLVPRYRDLDNNVICLLFSFLDMDQTQVMKQAVRSNGLPQKGQAPAPGPDLDTQIKRGINRKDKVRI